MFVEPRLQANARAYRFSRRWHLLCARYLPICYEDSVWRFNRDSRAQDPTQGWKLHISATILEACDVFEKVAPFLAADTVHFKAPRSLDELSKINSGLHYGYHQIGKFITIYPSTEKKAVELAGQLHKLTRGFQAIPVAFDEQYLPESSIFYRYGAFLNLQATKENGETFPAIINREGELVPDDRLKAVPDWVVDPFPKSGRPSEKTFAETPLGKTYRIFSAITQRGKGGTYEAVDMSRDKPRLCIVKEGRRNGEIGWNDQDGYLLVRNEFEVLGKLRRKYEAVPQVFSSFEVHGNYYFAMEYVQGKSLRDIMGSRLRRFSVRRVLEFAAGIAEIIEKVHRAGWVWNDCKPANLIVTMNGTLRPIDFEGAYPIGKSELFDWKTEGFSRPSFVSSEMGESSSDLYALGAVIYFLLTGEFYDGENPVEIGKLRRGVPPGLVKLTRKLLSDRGWNISNARNEIKAVAAAIGGKLIN